ncbi:DUF1156 domain-containing protein [Jongsikchunia kroppenstedtii]|uniref:DUF1156 domain-containing protein n=1 Tax=Jongsikchunia kroppenstedtii TaxID=1121721 RepID=UPI00039D8899|nr:DUF1156 domain-containing protein [Jongsikchunia kroppenstedtii]
MSTDAQHVGTRRKLIEVALPLQKINEAAAAKRPVKHPWSMSYWWARRPLPVARAVLFAQLVDDPSSDPALSPDEVLARRRELHELLEELVIWDKTNNERVLERARIEILKSTGGNPPPVFDPFAGGGTIPLEAQRLGLTAHASDLNPVAVLINKALVEIPPKFAGQPPVYPGAAAEQITSWPRANGLAEDVRRYGQWMRDEAENRIGHIYPKATLSNGSQATVIAWIWARTIKCPNPACGIRMPLVRSWWLSKKKGKEAYAVPSVQHGKVHFEIARDPGQAPPNVDVGTMSGKRGGICVGCGSVAETDYIKAEGRHGRLGEQLIATIVDDHRRKAYLPPTPDQESAAEISRPPDVPDQELGYHPKDVWTPPYGLTRFSDLFTHRQLNAITVLSDLIMVTRDRVLTDALLAGLPEELDSNRITASGYADAIATYLALALNRAVDNGSSITTWHNKNEQIRSTFSRQAISMSWDFLEPNLLSNSLGSWSAHLKLVVDGIPTLPAYPRASAHQAAAESADFTGYRDCCTFR